MTLATKPTFEAFTERNRRQITTDIEKLARVLKRDRDEVESVYMESLAELFRGAKILDSLLSLTESAIRLKFRDMIPSAQPLTEPCEKSS
ncbi:MAG: hypothetical protein Q7S22_02760 [Candidatus Micrarchaeota archaeon]|nr:hypothetical protein [Candidatus Micrarchaeota archaeon]